MKHCSRPLADLSGERIMFVCHKIVSSCSSAAAVENFNAVVFRSKKLPFGHHLEMSYSPGIQYLKK